MRRGRIIPTTVTYERDGNIALIQLTGFNSATTDELHPGARQGAQGDRPRPARASSSTCAPTAAACSTRPLSVAEVFIGDGVIFSTQGRHPDSQRTYRSDSSRTDRRLPMVVLVNGNSASAAEIVAAALQDRGRAAVVGTTSYGKGTVQTVIRLPNEGELILTWSRLMAPSGYTWNEQGVMPNICTAKVTDISTAGPDLGRCQPSRCCSAGMPSAIPATQEVVSLRKICPPGEEIAERDVDIASRLLQRSDAVCPCRGDRLDRPGRRASSGSGAHDAALGA